jgi:hypothetical protein
LEDDCVLHYLDPQPPPRSLLASFQ